MRGADAIIAALAGGQFGVVARWQVLAAGISRSQIERRLGTGRLHRIHPGVFAVGHGWLSHEGRCMAALLAVGHGAALASVTAARWWEIRRRRGPRAIHVVTTRRCRTRLHGVRVHHTRSLPDGDVTVHRGLRVTTPERTIVDLAAVVDAHELANVMHEADFREVLIPSEVRRVLDRFHNRANATHAVVERALSMHALGCAGSRSELEARFRRALARSGAPEPLSGMPVPVRRGTIEVDLHWPTERLCVEIDGAGHGRARSRREDRRRDARLRDAGYPSVRVPAELIDRSLKQAVQLVLDALRSIGPASAA